VVQVADVELKGIVEANCTEKLWREHHGALRAFIQKRGCSANIADDILQDVFVKVHTKLPAMNEPHKIRSWLYTTVKNHIADHFRTTAPCGDFPEDMANLHMETDATQKVVFELSSCLQPMIDQLPDPYRRALCLSDLQGLSRKDLAKREGISLSGAKSRVSRGRALLKELLADCCTLELDGRGMVYDYRRNVGRDHISCSCEK